MDQLKPFFDVVALIANVFAIVASGIGIYIFFAKRRELAQALQLLLNFSLQTTLSEVKEKLERLNEYNAAEPTEQEEIRNIFHEIAGQVRGNRHLVLPPYLRTQPIRNVAPVVRAERGAFAQLVAA